MRPTALRPTAVRPTDARPTAVRMSPRSGLVLAVVSVAGLAMFLWPLILSPTSGISHNRDAPFIFALILPALIAVLLAELHGANGIDTKALAMLGVLTAFGAVLRPLGAGVAGIETVFFLLILAGRVYGPGFGFVLEYPDIFEGSVVVRSKVDDLKAQAREEIDRILGMGGVIAAIDSED